MRGVRLKNQKQPVKMLWAFVIWKWLVAKLVKFKFLRFKNQTATGDWITLKAGNSSENPASLFTNDAKYQADNQQWNVSSYDCCRQHTALPGRVNMNADLDTHRQADKTHLLTHKTTGSTPSQNVSQTNFAGLYAVFVRLESRTFQRRSGHIHAFVALQNRW